MKTKYDFSNVKASKKCRGLKVQKNFRLDPEVLLWLEEQGEKQSIGYQTYLNWFLNRQMSDEKTVVERLANLEAEICKKKRARNKQISMSNISLLIHMTSFKLFCKSLVEKAKQL